MSHFLVIVETKTRDASELETVLQPFHEYECTGIKDQYVSFVDHHDEVLKEYEEKTRTHYKISGDDTIYDLNSPEIYRDPTPEEVAKHGPIGLIGTGTTDGKFHMGMDKNDGRGYRNYFKREDVEEIELPFKHSYPTVEKFAKDWEGYEVENGRFGRWTNPNKRWDWWTVGGRYSGRLVANGRTCDQARKGSLDLDKMSRNKAEARMGYVRTAYDKISENMLADGVMPDANITAFWQERQALLAKLSGEWEGIKDGKPFYQFLNGNPRFVELRKWGIDEIGEWGAGVPETEPDPIAWASRNVPGLSAIAFLGLDGVWREKGEMGWWGVIHDEKKDSDWDQEFNVAINAIPEDHLISCIDCHI